MQVYKCFLKIVRRFLPMILMYFGIFLALVIAFSNVPQPQGMQTFEGAEVKLTVIDHDNSQTSETLRNLLYSRHEEVDLPDGAEKLQDALYDRSTEYILIIPAGYEQALMDGGGMLLETVQLPDSYSGTYVDHLVESYVSAVRAYINAGTALPDALSMAMDDMAVQVDVAFATGNAQASAQPDKVFYFYNYLVYSLMLMLIFGLCPVLMVFREKPLAMRMDSSALPLARKNVELGLGAATLALVCFGMIIGVGFLMYGSGMLIGNSAAGILNAACFLLVSTAMAFFIGQVSTSGNVLSALANVTGLSLCFLGGVFVPLEFMGTAMQNVAKFTPTYWYVTALDHVYESGSVTPEVWQGMGMQLLFAVAFFAAALAVIGGKRRRVA